MPIRHFFAFSALTLCACAGVGEAQDRRAPPVHDLSGTRWTAVDVAGIFQLEDPIPMLEFENASRLRGNGGCNPFGAAYRAFGERLEVDGIMRGARDCEPDLVTQQNTMVDVLDDAWTYSVAGDELTIIAHDRRILRFRRAG